MRSHVILGILLALVVALPAGAQTGEGCTDLAVAAQVAQGAFNGTVADVRPEAGNTQTVVTFDVTKVFTGPIPSEGTVEVWFENGRHGWPEPEGEIGVLVRRDDARWISDSCLVTDAATLTEIGPVKVSPQSLGDNERETLKEPPLWIFFGIFGGGISIALWWERRRRSVPR